MVRLFEGDSVAGLDEGALLERFATRRDEAAFEALVGRLGPMVLGVCKRMLTDPHDADDAFQATFLVLIKRAGSIRDRALVAPWLYGVALKVARRARVESARRKARERLAVVADEETAEGLDSGWSELRTLIDEEIGRLSEPHRRAVVLCDVEGLTREEAASRLGWSVNMVRGRLERARGRLRDRLARRGVAPSGAWAALLVAPSAPSTALVASTIRLAVATSIGAGGLAVAPAVALSQGVLRMMMLSKLKFGLAILASAGVVAGGSVMVAAQGPGDKPVAKATTPAQAQAPDETKPFSRFETRPAAELAKARVEAAEKRLQQQKAFYNEGRITIDRVIDASRGLMQARLDATTSRATRVGAAKIHYDQMKEILKREQAELEAGRATEADISEINSAVLEREFTLTREMEARLADRNGQGNPNTVAGMLGERAELARKILADASRLYPSEITVDDYLAASRLAVQAELDAAPSLAGRRAALEAQAARLRQAEASIETFIAAKERRALDGWRIKLSRLDAEVALAKEGPGSNPPNNPTDLEHRLADLERKVDRLVNLIDASKR